MAFLRRFEKIRRYLRWRLAPREATPVWWHVGRPNFGDDINPTFFRQIHNRPVRFAARRSRPHILGAGSILEHALPTSVVCGSGFLSPPRRQVVAEFVAVRGELSARGSGGPAGVLLGDPLVLIDAFVAATPTRGRIGYVPHVTSAARWRRSHAGSGQIIDPAWAPWRTIAAIATCEILFSQSLHGLIVADSLGIPSVWVAPNEVMSGGRFKFDDYFSTLDRDKPAVPEGPDLFEAPQRYEPSIGRYRFCKQTYRNALAAACDRVASAAGG